MYSLPKAALISGRRSSMGKNNTFICALVEAALVEALETEVILDSR
jgi:hypothetical protein